VSAKRQEQSGKTKALSSWLFAVYGYCYGLSTNFSESTNDKKKLSSSLLKAKKFILTVIQISSFT